MRPIVYDILRLFIGPSSATPRGIDRVDLAYAEYLFAHWPGEIAGVMPTPWGVRLYDRALVLRGLARLAGIWGETDEEDDGLSRIKAQLRGEVAPAMPSHSRGSPISRQWQLIRTTGVPLGRSVREVRSDALYLNVGQLGWAAPLAMGWLERRPEIQVAVMLHDAIPIEHPLLVSRSGAAAHRQMMRVAARHIDGLITTTEAARNSVVRELAARGAGTPRSLTLPLPLAPGFLAPDRPDPALAALDYYVICGAIEPRKNHLMLLQVWRRLVELLGDRAPKLVVVGAAAQGARPSLAAMAALPGHVIHAGGLSTPGLRRLIRSARALLMPSLAEGFGLPVQEALALGTPVIASDLRAHREIAAGLALLLAPDREQDWLDAILETRAGGGLRAPKGYQPMDAGRYFEAIAQWLTEFPLLPQNEDCGTKSSLQVS